VPIFDQEGELHQVVVSSRPILSLQTLHEDYARFLKDIKDEKTQHVEIRENSTTGSNSHERLVGSSLSLKEVSDLIDKAAPTDATILITGESGVGKEVVADEIYRTSKRQDKTFVKINCASIPANLLESELFGYEKGAFTGANATGKKGLFETANGGTLFLDEIGEMPMDLQVKLLRAIQDKVITRVGGTRPIPLDIRFIAATNCDLKEKIAAGEFRQDLYYRLNVIPITIPPLRKRPKDIDDLIEHFRVYFSQKHDRPLVFSESNLALFRSYRWPGNVRELENVVEYLTICASGGDHVDEKTIRGILDISQESIAPSETATLSQQVESYEKNLLESVLRNSTSLRDAGAKLGVNASTISRKIKQYGIDYPGKK
jgi:transcriptional regulator with PAS, ATPase and Fis domain